MRVRKSKNVNTSSEMTKQSSLSSQREDCFAVLAMTRYAVVFVLAVCSLVYAQEEYRISELKVTGNLTISNSDIYSRIRSRPGEIFNEQIAQNDAKRIGELEGVNYSYYSTQIAEGELVVTFVVIEQTLVRSIEFEGNKKFKDKALRKISKIELGDYVDPVLIQTATESIIEKYKNKGYTFVEVELDEEKLPVGRVVYNIAEGPRVKIAKVKFEGNEELESGELGKVAKSKTRSFLIFQNYLQDKKVEEDVTRLLNAYYNQGYLNAKVKGEPELSEDKKKAVLKFVIDEGPQYSVEEIGTIGNEFYSESELKADLKLEEGKAYSKSKAESDLGKVLKMYREKGFIDADVELGRQYLEPNQVRVIYDIDEGGRYRIGKVKITGNQITQDKVVRRILDEYEFVPGNWYNADLAKGNGEGYLEKLVRRGIYADAATPRSVTIAPESDDIDPNSRNAVVNVTEGQTGSIMVGGGIASDSGAFAQVVLEQRNFDIWDTPESWNEFLTGKAFRGAGQSLRLSLMPGTEVTTYSVDFTEPYLYNKPVAFNLGASRFERGRESYDEERTKGYFGFTKRHKEKWRTGLNFRFENVDVADIEPDAPLEIIDVEGGNFLSGVRLSLGRDMRNDIYNPSAGYDFDVSYEQVFGDFSFGILSGNYIKFHTLYENLAEHKTVLSNKIVAATTVGDAPPFEKFYAGGSGFYGIRGFDYRGVSTRGLPTLNGVPIAGSERKDPIGSDWIFLASSEVLMPITSENFAALLFVDSGTIDTGPYRFSIGTGIQILIPQWFGPVPLRVEFSTPLQKGDEDETQIFSFSVGRLF